MSWSFQIAGKRDTVLAKIDEFKSYPYDGDQSQINTAKSAVKAIIAANGPEAVFNVYAAGHSNGVDALGNGIAGNTCTVKVEGVYGWVDPVTTAA